MTPKDWESAIDKQIREAREKGQFDDLPGKGKPLDLTPNPYASDKDMAYKVLKDAGYAPEWIEMDKSIRSRLERARRVLARQWAWYQERLDELAGRSDGQTEASKKRSTASWQRAVGDFEEVVTTINRDIADLNLKVPNPHFQRFKIDAAAEVAAIEKGGK
jgi:DnaJ family protein C protein 28